MCHAYVCPKCPIIRAYLAQPKHPTHSFERNIIQRHVHGHTLAHPQTLLIDCDMQFAPKKAIFAHMVYVLNSPSRLCTCRRRWMDAVLLDDRCSLLYRLRICSADGTGCHVAAAITQHHAGASALHQSAQKEMCSNGHFCARGFGSPEATPLSGRAVPTPSNCMTHPFLTLICETETVQVKERQAPAHLDPRITRWCASYTCCPS